MSSIIRYMALGLTLVCMFIFLGCGDQNADAPDFNYEKSEDGHPDDWLPSEHAKEAREDLSFCTECHGASFNGGIARVSCFTCHMGDENHVHPLDWEEFTYVRHDEYVENNSTSRCSNVSCHGANLQGVSGSGPYCSSCHLGDTVVDGTIVFSIHPAGWDVDLSLHGAYVLANGTSSCSNITCHGGSLEGVPGSGPRCDLCHPFP